MDEPIAVSKKLTKVFGPSSGVFDLDLELPAGEIIGFIGPSGSGKTTTVRLMTGVIGPDAGTIRVLGERPTDFSPDTRAKIGYMPQEAILYPDLTLGQNLSFAASLQGLTRSQRSVLGELVDLLEIAGVLNRLPDEASGGERRRLVLASALVHTPTLLFLDEPTAGIDPVLRRRIWERLQEISGQGRSLVVTTQYVGEAAYCDHVAVLAEGRLLAYETPLGLRRKAYGGELIDLSFDTRPTAEQVGGLESHLNGRLVDWIDDRSARLVVEDAGEAAPRIVKWAADHSLDLLQAEAYVPPFDDVFVDLVASLDGDHDPIAPASAEGESTPLDLTVSGSHVG